MAKEVFDDIRANLERNEPRLGSKRRDFEGYTNAKLGRVLPRYLSPPLSSCHDSCKSVVAKCNGNHNGTAKTTTTTTTTPLNPTGVGSGHGTAKTKRHFISATKLQKTPTDENKKQTTSSRANRRRVLASAENLSSSKTKGTSRARQKGSIPRQSTKRDEENIPEKTLYVVEEHRVDDSTNNKLSPARGEILEGPLHKNEASPRKVVVQYMFVDREEDSEKLLSCDKMAENKTEAAENNVKTLIGVFESVIALRDGTSSPAALR